MSVTTHTQNKCVVLVRPPVRLPVRPSVHAHTEYDANGVVLPSGDTQTRLRQQQLLRMSQADKSRPTLAEAVDPPSAPPRVGVFCVRGQGADADAGGPIAGAEKARSRVILAGLAGGLLRGGAGVRARQGELHVEAVRLREQC